VRGAPGPTYVRRQPEKTALHRVMQEHLLTFEQQWIDEASGRTLPKFVTEELLQYHGFNLRAATRVAANDKPGRKT
jgi:hypothetical protein